MIICPRCAGLLPEWLFRDSQIDTICTRCQSSLEVYSFAALYRPAERVDLARMQLGEGEASCYEHASKKAAALCSNCGRFLCAMCEVQLGGAVFCPDCVQGNRSRPALTLETQRTKFDSIALALAVWPLLIFYFTVLTAPLALGMSIYAWNKPSSILRHSRWRIFAAMGISLLEIGGIVLAIAAIVQTYGKVRR